MSDTIGEHDDLHLLAVNWAYSHEDELNTAQSAALAREKAIYDERLLEAASQLDLGCLAIKKGLSATDFLDAYRAVLEHYSQPRQVEILESMLELRQRLVEGEVFVSWSDGPVIERIASVGDGQPVAQPSLRAQPINSGSYLERNNTYRYVLVWMVSVDSGESDDGEVQTRVIDTSSCLGRAEVSDFLDHDPTAKQMPDTIRADGYNLIGQNLKATGHYALAAAKAAARAAPKAAYEQARQHLPRRSER